jgi:hypothetical protein
MQGPGFVEIKKDRNSRNINILVTYFKDSFIHPESILKDIDKLHELKYEGDAKDHIIKNG